MLIINLKEGFFTYIQLDNILIGFLFCLFVLKITTSSYRNSGIINDKLIPR